MYNETRRAAHCGAQQARDESRAADSEDLNVTKRKIGILGAGTWGMALARMLCVSGNDVLVWSAIEKEIDALSSTRVHPNLPGMKIPKELRFTKSVEEVCRDKDILLFAVPSVFVRSTAAKARPYVAEGQIIVDVAKGVEPDTLMTMTEILADELGKEGGPKGVRLVALSGPTHAEEVAVDLPTTIVSASPGWSVRSTSTATTFFAYRHSCCVSGPMPGPTSNTPHVSSTPDSSTMFCGTQLCVRKFCPLALEKWNPCRASSALISLILQRSIVGLPV